MQVRSVYTCAAHIQCTSHFPVTLPVATYVWICRNLLYAFAWMFQVIGYSYMAFSDF